MTSIKRGKTTVLSRTKQLLVTNHIYTTIVGGSINSFASFALQVVTKNVCDRINTRTNVMFQFSKSTNKQKMWHQHRQHSLPVRQNDNRIRQIVSCRQALTIALIFRLLLPSFHPKIRPCGLSSSESMVKTRIVH